MWASSTPSLAQRVPLGGAGGGVHLGARGGRAGSRPCRRRRRRRGRAPLAGPSGPARSQAVAGGKKTEGTAAACAKDQPSGIRATSRRSATAAARRPGEEAHHPVARGEVADLRADLHDDARALAADRGVAGVHAQAISTSRKFSPAARTATRTSVGPSGSPAPGQEPGRLVQGAPLSGKEPPGARRGGRVAQGAGRVRPRGTSGAPSRRASWGSPTVVATATASPSRGARAVGVDQGEAAGVLGLGGAEQAPDGGLGEIGGLPLPGGDSAIGQEDKARAGQGLCGEPPLHQLQGALGRGAGCARSAGAFCGSWPEAAKHGLGDVRAVLDRLPQGGEIGVALGSQALDPCLAEDRRDWRCAVLGGLLLSGRSGLHPLDSQQALGAAPRCLQLLPVETGRTARESTSASAAPLSSASAREISPSPRGLILTRSPSAPPASRETPRQAKGIDGCRPAETASLTAENSIG